MMANELAGRYFDAGKILFKEPSIPAEVEEYKEPVNLDELFGGLNLHKLKEVFDRVMKQKENRIDKVRSNFGTIKKEPVSLETKITEVMAYARKHRKFTFKSLLESQVSKLEVVVTFLSVLELMKIGKITSYTIHFYSYLIPIYCPNNTNFKIIIHYYHSQFLN